MTWVRFHGELRQGEKRGISRASRFIYMELSHEARPKRGFVVLPVGLADVDAACELLGGNRAEVKRAIDELTAGADPMVRFEDWQGKRVITVVNWEKWNPPGDHSGPRVKEWRRKQKRVAEQDVTRNGNALHDVTVTGSEPDVTRGRALARVDLSLSSLSEISSSEQISSKTATSEPSGTRCVKVDDALSDELRAAASIIGVQDIESAWLAFCGKRSGQWVNVAGAWQAFCATWRTIERRDPPSATRLRSVHLQPEPKEGRRWKVGQ